MDEKYCKQCGRILDSRACRKGLCSKHYIQQLKYGEFLDDSPYNKNDPNDIIEYSDYAEVILRDVYGYELARVKIDVDDIPLISQYKWSFHHSGYSIARINGHKVQMHRLIINAKDGDVVDHINHNGLDNRKYNLRICTTAQNEWNARKSPRNTSGVKGVNYDKSRNKWRARISYNGKRIELGFFETKEEAEQARFKAEDELHGEFRCDE